MIWQFKRKPFILLRATQWSRHLIIEFLLTSGIDFTWLPKQNDQTSPNIGKYERATGHFGPVRSFAELQGARADSIWQ